MAEIRRLNRYSARGGSILDHMEKRVVSVDECVRALELIHRMQLTSAELERSQTVTPEDAKRSWLDRFFGREGGG
jgi:hypothetical protein